MKLLILSNLTFFHNFFLKHFSSMCLNEYIWRKGLIDDLDKDQTACNNKKKKKNPLIYTDFFPYFFAIFAGSFITYSFLTLYS